MSLALGRLSRVTIRDVWAHEAHAFTPWLALPENITLLGEALRLEEIEVLSTEAAVGHFSTDIVAQAAGGTTVLIENQIEATDHRHLGQLLTYLAGQPDKDVVTIWIATQFREEHRAAIDWLNTNTNDSFEFFGVEIEVLKIGEGPPAPRFNVVAKPNDWSRSVRTTADGTSRGPVGQLRPSFQLRQAYWDSFAEFLKRNNSTFRVRRHRKDNSHVFPIGRSGAVISATISPNKKRIGVEFYIHHGDKIIFRALLAQKAQIEREFGAALEWQELPHRKASRIAYFWNNVDPADPAMREDYHVWMLSKMDLFRSVFGERVRKVDRSVMDADSD